ncbi:MAG: diguanylate cyclase, partial [Spirochaetales bacterium]|nr:diguanylate cyclase [Spirochaetales bacterium]
MTDRYKYIVDSSQDFITLINRDYVYEIVNPAYEKVLMKPRTEIINKSVSYVWGEKLFKEKIKEHIDKCFSGEEIHYVDTFKFGDLIRYMHVSYYPFKEVNEEVTHALVFTSDLSELGKVESKLKDYKYRDPLTGLYNRNSFDIILDIEIEKAKRVKTDKLRAILFIDIINFKSINRKFNHEIGNILLENTGIRIKDCIRDTDYTFSYQGSELVVFLSSISSKHDAGRVAEKLYTSIIHPYQHNKYSIKLQGAIGIAIFPDDGDNKSELMMKAISASDEAERLGLPYSYFDENLHYLSKKRLELEAELTTAFQNNEFVLYYQPIVDVSGEIVGAEALIRWNHRQKGLISPVDFIPIAEDTGLIEEIGKWVIFSVSRQLSEWIKIKDIYISFNLSAREFLHPELISILK